MPVYHITLHAYRSWRADHPRGYTHRKKGVLAPDPEVAKRWDELAKHPQVEFDHPMQSVLITGCADICARRGSTFHGGACDSTHGHFLISWRNFVPINEVERTLKNLPSLMLGRLAGEKGRRWFVADGSRRRVVQRAHFDHLIETYFPDHKFHWIEGGPLPEIADHVIDELRASARGLKGKSVHIARKRKQPARRSEEREP